MTTEDVSAQAAELGWVPASTPGYWADQDSRFRSAWEVRTAYAERSTDADTETDAEKIMRLALHAADLQQVNRALVADRDALRSALTYLVAVYAHVSPDDMSLGQDRAWARARVALSESS